MDTDELEAELSPHQEELALLATEADRRLADVNRRLDNAASRGAIVVSAAAIASGVQVAQGASFWLIASVLASLIAAALALPLMRFKRGQEVNVGQLVKDIANWSPQRLKLEVINAKTVLVNVGEDWMRSRGRLLLASLAALAVAIVFTVLRVILG